MRGRACLRGQRITVSHTVGQIAQGATVEELLAEFPSLERDDIRQALEYGAWLARERIVQA